jgi:cyanophycinase-like exopeptidase
MSMIRRHVIMTLSAFVCTAAVSACTTLYEFDKFPQAQMFDAGADATATVDAPADSDSAVAPLDAAPLDGSPIDLPSRALTLSPRVGAAADDPLSPSGATLVLDGGYSGSQLWPAALRACAGGAVKRCDVVTLSADGGVMQGQVLGGAQFNSAQSISLLTGATDADFRIAASLIDKAEVIYFMGGDQAKYVRWAGNAVMAAVQRVYDRGGVVGGGSAGMIILGSSVNNAFNTISENITTAVCLADPYDAKIAFSQNVFRFAPLARTITDPHFIARDRMGRLATFMARQVQDGLAAPDMLGVGVDDGAAVIIDANGLGRILPDSTGAAYVVRGGKPTTARAGAPLVYRELEIIKLANSANSYNFTRRCGAGPRRTLEIDGNLAVPYTDAYLSGPVANTCL